MIDWIRNFPKRLQHDVMLVSGKKSAEVLTTPGGTAHVATGVAAGGTGALAITTLGLASGVSAALTQIEHNREKREIRNLYKEELGAQLKKPHHKLTTADLHVLAEGSTQHGVMPNRIIAEAVDKSRRIRNVGLVLAVAATVAALTGTHWAIHAGLFSALSGATSVVAQLAASLFVYTGVKSALGWVADKALGLDRETAHERIVEIVRSHEEGKAVSREMVFSVIAMANPDMKALIKARYGKGFNELKFEEQQRLTQSIGSLIHVGELTDLINSGAVNATELAFTAEGRLSGVPQKDGSQPRHEPGLISSMWHRITSVFHGKEAAEPQAPPAEYVNEPPQKPFTEKLGLARTDTSLGHVERLAERGEELPAVQR